MTDQPANLSPVKRALLALEEMQEKLRVAEHRMREPLAIVGMSCRLPGGADDPESFWKLLHEGRDAVTEVPAERWDVDAYYDPDPSVPGKMTTRWGGFLADVASFDPELFGISPREAETLDPQQRLLLELVWEALERAGHSPERLAGTRTGVFVGIAGSDYAQILSRFVDAARIDAYFASGVAHSIASGRISYSLGLSGPSLSIDTACSSSLVAVHQACQSVRARESDIAIAAGVNIVLLPDHAITFSKSQMMAADGRCKTFDARADGFVRAEGCGVVIIKRLADALANGDPVLAVIRGTAVNQDGASSGLTAPNGAAQEALLRDALANAGMRPEQIGYIEAHGTGTSLGDPIEVRAIGKVFAPGRSPDAPLYIGSVKTNLGHTEATAGIAGLIKAVLCLQHREIPASLHFQTPNPHMAWDELPVAVPTSVKPFPSAGAPRAAGVSSFGFSGTNAHVIVEEAPEPAALERTADRGADLLLLSAKSEAALRALAGRYVDHLRAHPEQSVSDICHTTRVGRAHFAYRAGVVAADRAQLIERLERLSGAGVVQGQLSGSARVKVAFLFTGQGSQYVGMGKDLYASEAVFRDVVDRCAEALRGDLERDLRDVMFEESGGLLDQTRYTQPALYALEVGLARLWQSWGVEPTVVLGHSVGEYAAACVAGVYELEAGARLIAERGRGMQGLPGSGSMLAVQGGVDEVEAAVARHLGSEPQVCLAVRNAPGSVVLSGSRAGLERLQPRLQAEGLRAQPLVVSHGFHSEQMQPMLDEYERYAQTVEHRAPQVQWVSNLSGSVLQWAEWSGRMGQYWRRHVREPVQFEAGIRAVAAEGVDVFVEMGPHPVLCGLGRATLTTGTSLWAGSLQRQQGSREGLLGALAQLYARGVRIDWSGFAGATPYRTVSLPTYPFQRQRYWIEHAPSAVTPAAVDTTLLGKRVDSPAVQGSLFSSRIGPGTAGAFALDHRVFGVPILPATGYIAMAFDAATQVLGSSAVQLTNFGFQEALPIPETSHREVQLVARREGKDARIEIFSRAEQASEWRLHASAVATQSVQSLPPVSSFADAYRRCVEPIDHERFYESLHALGLEFESRFRGIRRLGRAENEAVGEVSLPQSLHAEARHYAIHPVLLDACLQVVAAAVAHSGDSNAVYLPIEIADCRIYPPPKALISCRAHARLSKPHAGNAQLLNAELDVYDEAGTLVATLRGMHFKRANKSVLEHLRVGDVASWLIDLTWDADATDLQRVSPRAIAKAVRSGIPERSVASGWEQWNEVEPRLDRVCRAYIARALSDLDTDAVVKPEYVRLLGRFRKILESGGVVTPAPNPDEELGRLRRDYPAFHAELEFTARCGPELKAVLTGASDPLQLLFPGGNAATAEHLYRDSPSAKLFNGVVRDVVTAAVAQLPAGRPIRVLEIGGGTASTTSHVVSVLPADRTEYVFSDVSPLFAARANERFASLGFLTGRVLDIERDPHEQGVTGEFDIIIAANVLHATRDLGETFANIRKLLSPSGVLLCAEITRPQDWIDLSFGLTEGWWRFSDSKLRPDYPLLTREQWSTFLSDAGFDEVAMLPEAEGASRALTLNAVMVARAKRVDWLDTPRRLLLVGDRGGTAWSTIERLRAQGHAVCVAHEGNEYARESEHSFVVDPLQRAHFDKLLGDARTALNGSVEGVIHLWAVDRATLRTDELSTLQAQMSRLMGGALHLAQAMIAGAGTSAPPLWIATRAGISLGAQPVLPMAGALWGWARSLRLEHPELRCVSVDLDPGDVAGNPELVLQTLSRTDEEREICWRDQIAHVSRLRPATSTPAVSTADTPRRLIVTQRGELSNLTLREEPRGAPGPGQIEVRVRAMGLNFRDVLNALGMYPGDPGPLGSEFSGRVLAVGSGVTSISPGDDVIGLAHGAFTTHLVTDAVLVAPKPRELTYAEAASLPNVMLTAHWALNFLGKMKSGERVLIHAAAGGVGLAAVQLAQRAGAEIYATAGSQTKRDYLRSLGVKHVFNSRTLHFAGEIRALTGGRGVDLVLNSLAGEFIGATFSTLAPNGRFLEIGRTGVWSDADVRARYPGVAYHLIDLGQDYVATPERIRPMMVELIEAVRSGELRPLPLRTFALSEAEHAFRFMARARHVGKIVLTVPYEQVPGSATLRNDASYLITGGLSGLGPAVAEWMVAKGARNLVLMSRRPAGQETKAAIARMSAEGATVLAMQGDVSVEADVRGALQRMRESGLPPLAGVIHAAGLLDDGAIESQTVERYQKVFAAKVQGAWLLRKATANRDLDFFVLFSSAAGLFGSAGQTNHGAANAWLDAFAHSLRFEGCPAVSIDWGAWSDIGAAASAEVAERLRENGIERLSPAAGLAALHSVMLRSPAQIGVVAADWNRFVERLPASVRRYMSALAKSMPTRKREIRPEPVASNKPSLAERLASTPADGRRGLLQADIKEHASEVLRLPSTHRMDVRSPLADLGLDSLMAVELRNRLSRATGKTLPATLLFDYPTVDALGDKLAQLLEIEPSAPDVDVTPAAPGDDLLGRLSSLSDDEIDRLIATKTGS